MGDGQRGVVELLVDIPVGNGIVPDFFPQVAAERFRYWKDDTAVLCVDGISRQKIEDTQLFI